MQLPTCSGMRIRSSEDALLVIYAACVNKLPRIARRLNAVERLSIASGAVYVWQERDATVDPSGIERWTDGLKWNPQRIRRGSFLIYNQIPDFRASAAVDKNDQHSLIKQTFSATMHTAAGRRKMHLIAYFSPDNIVELSTVGDNKKLQSLAVPDNIFHETSPTSTSSRSVKDREDLSDNSEDSVRSTGPQRRRRRSPKQSLVHLQFSLSPRASGKALPSRSKLSNSPPSVAASAAAFRSSTPLLPKYTKACIYSESSASQQETSSAPPVLAPMSFLNGVQAPPRNPFDQSMINSLSMAPS